MSDPLPRLTVATDARWFRSGGIGRYATEVISRLPYDVITLQPPYPVFDLRSQVWLARRLNSGLADIYFSAGVNPPLFSPIPYVFVIHDLIPLNFPDETSATKTIYFHTLVRAAGHLAEKVLTVSEFSRDEIVDRLGLDPRKVQVIPNGVSDRFKPRPSQLLGGEDDRFILYVGNKRPHKNLRRALTAFSISGIHEDYDFVLSGNPHTELIELASELGVENAITFAGELDDSSLIRLYQDASILLFPSLYEGFGLPVLEAMACGTPVITSNTSGLPETAGDAALLADPTDPNEIAERLDRLASDAALRRRLISRGLKRARSFSWDRTARQVAERLLKVTTEST